MAKLLLVAGKKGSGALEWVSRWYAEDTAKRRIGISDTDVNQAIKGGLEVAIRVLPPLVDATARSKAKQFPGLEIEVVRVA